MRKGEIELRRVREWILSALDQSAGSIVLRPRHAGWKEQVYVDTILALEIGTDSVVGCQLRERAGATRPLVSVMNLLGVVVVVGIVEAGPVRHDGIGTGNSVIQDALHAIAIARVFRDH